MTEVKQSVLTRTQTARAEALRTARDVLSSTSFFAKGVPSDITGLIKVAEWVLGPEQERRGNSPVGLAGFLDVTDALGILSDLLPDCNSEDCAIHAPKRTANNATPEDFGTPGAGVAADTGTMFWDATPPEPVTERETEPEHGMAEASDFSGGEADAANEKDNEDDFTHERIFVPSDGVEEAMAKQDEGDTQEQLAWEGVDSNDRHEADPFH